MVKKKTQQIYGQIKKKLHNQHKKMQSHFDQSPSAS